jgi:hypothetical protein
MRVEVHLLSQSKGILHNNIDNAYTKDGLYCIYYDDGVVKKYPLCNIFRIKEIEYPEPILKPKQVD